MKRIVIAGAGHAGVELSFALRKEGLEGEIVLLSDDPALPYQRPPLSKEFLKTGGINPLPLKAAPLYDANRIDLRLGSMVVEVDRDRRLIRNADGNWLAYDHLVFATGARNRRPDINGLDEILTLEIRALEQTRAFVEQLGSTSRVAIIGGGFIGLEVAAFLREKNITVDIVELADRLMARAVSRSTSDYYLELHQRFGADVHLSAQVKMVRRTTNGSEITLSTGRTLKADAVLLAAGVVPNIEVAAAAGLETGNGIVVDARLRTSDPHISAIGDCASFPCGYSNCRIRLESIQNSTDQARFLAKVLAAGDLDKTYCSLPWFWSYQGEARLQIAGVGVGHDRAVLRRDPKSGGHSVLLYRAGRLIAVESINATADHMAARSLLKKSISVPPDLASDLSHELKSFLASN